MSKRRIAVELVLIALALVGVLVFFLASSGWLASMAVERVPTSVDKRIGEAAAAQYKVSMRACSNPEAQRFGEDLLATLLKGLEGEKRAQGFAFEIHLIEESSINAFALPGGQIFVHSGLLEAAESADEVAGVLAHEIGHVLKRHGVERVLRSVGRRAIIGVLLGYSDVGVLVESAGVLHDLSYSREQEAESDRVAHKLLEKAGISSAGLAQFFERLDGGPSVPEFLSSHPSPASRAKRARDMGSRAQGRILPAVPSCARD